jgi:hypothetical protein
MMANKAIEARVKVGSPAPHVPGAAPARAPGIAVSDP